MNSFKSLTSYHKYNTKNHDVCVKITLGYKSLDMALIITTQPFVGRNEPLLMFLKEVKNYLLKKPFFSKEMIYTELL